MLEPCHYRISTKAIIRNEDKTKFLLMLEPNGYRGFPGGGMEHNEHPHEGLTRELEEEIGITPTYISPDPLHLITLTNSNHHQVAHIFYEVRLPHHQSTISDLIFVSREEATTMNIFSSVKKLHEHLSSNKTNKNKQ